MIKYVCGFLLDQKDPNKVVLIKKNRPERQKGLWNGVGGKVEKTDETISWAMYREFLEETGVVIPVWQRITTLYHPESEVWFYYAYGDTSLVKTVTDEEVAIHNINSFPANTFPNIKWLIGLVQDPYVKLPVTLYA